MAASGPPPTGGPPSSGGPPSTGGPPPTIGPSPGDLQAQLQLARGQILELQNARALLLERIKQLEATVGTGGAGGVSASSITATDFAQHLANVLDTLSAPAPRPGQQYAIAMTTLQVEARGLLSVAAGTQTILFAPAPPGGIDPNLLSTVTLTFKPIPVPGETTTPSTSTPKT